MKKRFLKIAISLASVIIILSGCNNSNENIPAYSDLSDNISKTNYSEIKTETQNQTKENLTVKAENEINTNIIEKALDTPFSLHGALKVDGTNLVDKNGEKFQLYGMSTHGIAWFPQYINIETFKTLRDDWNTNCIRIAMYTDEYGGYCSGGDKETLKNMVKNSVQYASELGMYVIIDWHVLNDCYPNVHKEDAKAFFNEMSYIYKNYDNIIYEICNEPNSSATWEGIKNYANEVIPIIRANDSNAVIIVGTPTWSQDINLAADSPLQYNKLMYSLHFYAATHTQWLRDRLTACINKGLPVFITEFGMCDASGNGSNNFEETAKWLELIQKYNLSYCCWNLANKNETSSIISPNSNKISGWEENDLSESGKWIKKYFKDNKKY